MILKICQTCITALNNNNRQNMLFFIHNFYHTKQEKFDMIYINNR